VAILARTFAHHPAARDGILRSLLATVVTKDPMLGTHLVLLQELCQVSVE
jgi:hypothetical protein